MIVTYRFYQIYHSCFNAAFHVYMLSKKASIHICKNASHLVRNIILEACQIINAGVHIMYLKLSSIELLCLSYTVKRNSYLLQKMKVHVRINANFDFTTKHSQ